MSTRLFFADVRPFLAPERLDAALPLLDDMRREKISRLKADADKARSVGAGLLLRSALAACGLPDDTPKLVFGDCGKPELARFPGIHFNLSHSGDYALCAVSDTPVGCDIEAPRPVDLHLAERFFAPSERQALAAAPEAEQHALFLKIWTQKESYQKAAGRGLSLPPASFSVVGADGTPRLSPAPELPFRLFSYAALPGYVLSLCAVCREKPPLERLTLSPEAAY